MMPKKNQITFLGSRLARPWQMWSTFWTCVEFLAGWFSTSPRGPQRTGWSSEGGPVLPCTGARSALPQCHASTYIKLNFLLNFFFFFFFLQSFTMMMMKITLLYSNAFFLLTIRNRKTSLKVCVGSPWSPQPKRNSGWSPLAERLVQPNQHRRIYSLST